MVYSVTAEDTTEKYLVKINGKYLNVVDRSEDETAEEMIEAGYVRVETESHFGSKCYWAESSDLAAIGIEVEREV